MTKNKPVKNKKAKILPKEEYCFKTKIYYFRDFEIIESEKYNIGFENK